MTTLERAVAVWKRCQGVQVGKCEECPLFPIGDALEDCACSILGIINDDPKLTEELNKMEAPNDHP